MARYAIYTSMTGGYDDLPQYLVVDKRFDYICFTNDYPDGSKVGIWSIKSIPVKIKDNIRLSRYAKLMPHKVLSEYDYSLWLDSNISIVGSELYEILLGRIQEGKDWYGVKHPIRNCIYEDAKEIVHWGNASYCSIARQVRFLHKENYPHQLGLFENNAILRKHNSENVVKIDEAWWKMYNKFSKRDQMSLFYLFWKYKFIPSLLFSEKMSTRNAPFIEWYFHPAPNKFLPKINKICKKKFRRYFNIILDTIFPLKY